MEELVREGEWVRNCCQTVSSGLVCIEKDSRESKALSLLNYEPGGYLLKGNGEGLGAGFYQVDLYTLSG
jgi:hypothetical protein